jgi:cytochrome c biogenesis protein CcdA
MTRRIAFGLLFIFGTIGATIGWIGSWLGYGQVGWMAIVGHIVQIIGIIGAMLVPDEVEVEDNDERRMID